MGTWMRWWSVWKRSATASDQRNSSPSSSPIDSKPMLKVDRSSWPRSRSSPTMRLESSPPDSSTPTGTSDTIRRSTARRSAAATASRHSSGDRSAGASVAEPQYDTSRRVPSGSTTSMVAGGSLVTPVRIVRGDGTTAWNVR